MPDKPEKLRSNSLTGHDHPNVPPSGAFKSGNPQTIAAAPQRSAEEAARASEDPYRSAMSMLDFYANRAGRNLSASERQALESAKVALRKRLGKPAD